MNHISKTLVAAGLISLANCSDQNNPNNPNNPGSTEWSIPKEEVFDGGPGKDGIPALTTPLMVAASQATYLKDDDLVIGYKRGNDIRAYPHPILDWHEIINDEMDGHPISIIYCPLTGTGTGWERTLNGKVTTFGVSGLLYNSNIIPYDRLTNSNWSQIRLDCVNGELRTQRVETFHTVETTWKTWKEMFPQTKVVSHQTGFSRNYNNYPYGDYKTNNNSFIFPVTSQDNRIPNKERVLGVISAETKDRVKVYRLASFEGENAVKHDNFGSYTLVLAGSKKNNFLVAFDRTLTNGTILTFSPTSFSQGLSPVILSDTEGNTWNVFGEAVSGPRTGQKLKPVISFIGYWFSWGAFYPNPEIFER